MKSIADIKGIKGKTILLRVDFNVPIDNGVIIEDTRIDASIKTINFLQKKGAKIVIVSHLGRPNGKKNSNYSLSLVHKVLKNKLKRSVFFCTNLKIKNLTNTITKMKSGSIILLENIRFLKYEEKTGSRYEKKLAQLFDVFVLDGFGVAHRKAMTVTEMPKYLPSYAGLSLLQEVQQLDELMHFTKIGLIIGGAKTETKLPVIKNLIDKSGYVLIGGGIVNTFLKSKGYATGSSIYSKKVSKKDFAVLDNTKVITPIDVVIKDRLGNSQIIDIGTDKKLCRRGEIILDIGPKTIQLYLQHIATSKIIIWNGPMGYIEEQPYHIGSVAIGIAVANSTSKKVKTVIGGGETIQLLKQINKLKKISIVSTGGGAMLEYLSGKELPGIVALQKNIL